MLIKIEDRVVLYVEDDKRIREGIVNRLNHLFKKVIATDNCEDGLRLYYQNDDIDIIITDIYIDKPNCMDGLDMVKIIRKNDRHTPIIITTAYGEKENLRRAVDLYLDGFLEKVFKYETLKNKLLEINEILLNREEDEKRKIEEIENRIRHEINEASTKPIINISETISYNPNNRTVIRENMNLNITASQGIFFELLCNYKNQIVSFATINNVFDREVALRALVCALKKRLSRNFSDIIIENIHGEGYRLRC